MMQAAVAARQLSGDNLVVAAGLSSGDCQAANAHEGTLLTACDMLLRRLLRRL